MSFRFQLPAWWSAVGSAAGVYALVGLGWVGFSAVLRGGRRGWAGELAGDLVWVAAGAGLVHAMAGRMRQRAEAAALEARRAEARLRVGMWEGAPDYIHVLDADGRLLEANAAFYRALGHESAPAAGLRVSDWDQGWATDEVGAKLAAANGRGVTREAIYRDRHGATRAVEVAVGEVASESGRMFFCIGRDLTERRGLERRTARAERIAGLVLLSGGIAHELNNSLASISLGGELLKQARPELANDICLKSILGAARNGAAVVHRVLTFAQGIEGERVEVDLAALLRGLADRVEARGHPGLRVRCEIASGLPPVIGDAAQLGEVLGGMITNALEALGDAGGLLVIGLRERRMGTEAAHLAGLPASGAYLECFISDTGHGLSPEARRQLFSPFFTTKPIGEGKGLGLAMGLGVVRSHGGMIEQVDPPGGGAEFRVLLPVARRRDRERDF